MASVRLETLRVAIYARVSTGEQSPELQLRELRGYADRRGFVVLREYVDQASGDAIEGWVKAGGVLLLFDNDRDNTEFEHFNTLTDRFGIHFNPVLSHHVIEPDHSAGEVVIPASTGIFGEGFTAYMKDTSTITATGPAKAVVTDHGDVMIAVAHVGKGTVFAVTDPWFYNEYADGRKMGQYRGFEAAQDVAAWAVRQVK